MDESEAVGRVVDFAKERTVLIGDRHVIAGFVVGWSPFTVLHGDVADLLDRFAVKHSPSQIIVGRVGVRGLRERILAGFRRTAWRS